jgi:hypothetical protein
MYSLARKTEPYHTAVRADDVPTSRESRSAPVAPALNTILAVREHAPAEIEELETEILQLHQKLGVAYARKRLLEQLLNVIRNADAENPPRTAMAVMR